jgi:hypothetical protein
MQLLRRTAHICAEVAALYALLLLAAWLLSSGLEPMMGQMALVFVAVTAVPASIVAATWGLPRRGCHLFGRWRRRHAPIRPLAALWQLARSALHETDAPVVGRRQTIDIRYTGSDLASYDVITALSEHLDRLGIPHTASGAIAVDIGGTSRWLEAEFGERRVRGWVQSESAGERQRVLAAIRGFLSHDLRLALV